MIFALRVLMVNRISLRQSRNITFAKAKISRRTELGISLSIPIAFAVGYFYVKRVDENHKSINRRFAKQTNAEQSEVYH